MANYVRAVAGANGFSLNVTQVQKILYIIYGAFLGKNDRIVLDETPQAWPYGPVFPCARSKADYSRIRKVEDINIDLLSEDKTVIDEIVSKYSKYPAGQLSKWSHTKDSPWDKTTKEIGFKWGTPIPVAYIKEYFYTLNV